MSLWLFCTSQIMIDYHWGQLLPLYHTLPKCTSENLICSFLHHVLSVVCLCDCVILAFGFLFLKNHFDDQLADPKRNFGGVQIKITEVKKANQQHLKKKKIEIITSCRPSCFFNLFCLLHYDVCLVFMCVLMIITCLLRLYFCCGCELRPYIWLTPFCRCRCTHAYT